MNEKAIEIVVPGTVVPKPRMTQRDKWAQRPCVMRYRAWSDLCRQCVREQVGKLPDPNDITRLDWVAYFEPPKSWSKKKRNSSVGQIHRQTPDRDNIDKAVLDTLFSQDQAIGVGTIEKRWGRIPELRITIEYA